MHQDVIMSCIDDPDISIRLQALELGSGMVNGDTLVSVVERLVQQLRNVPVARREALAGHNNGPNHGVEPIADSDGEDPEEKLSLSKTSSCDNAIMPDEYRVTIIHQTLEMCSRGTYMNILDFEWYIQILLELLQLVPFPCPPFACELQYYDTGSTISSTCYDISCAIGIELRNVAVRVNTVRFEAVNAADSMVALDERLTVNNSPERSINGALQHAAWIVGEFANHLMDQHSTLSSLLQHHTHSFNSAALGAFIQAIPKVFIAIIMRDQSSWDTQRKTIVSLLIARIVHFLEPLTTHPSLEVQERSVEYLELMRVAAEAVANHDVDYEAAPLLLTQALPSLFAGLELNPVAVMAQRKVPIPEGLDLDNPLNPNLSNLLRCADQPTFDDSESVDSDRFYNHRLAQQVEMESAADNLPISSRDTVSYQDHDDSTTDHENMAKKRAERLERNKDDPFHIASNEGSVSGATTPFHEILKSSNGEDVDIDSIPIMDLDVGERRGNGDRSNVEISKRKRKQPNRTYVTPEENISLDNSIAWQGASASSKAVEDTTSSRRDKNKRSLLEVDSSGIESLSLEANIHASSTGKLEIERQQFEEVEMAKALAEVERFRLEMQRTSERIRVKDDIPVEGTLVKKKKKKNILKPIEIRDKAGLDVLEYQARKATDPKHVNNAKLSKKKKRPKVAKKQDGGVERNVV